MRAGESFGHSLSYGLLKGLYSLFLASLFFRAVRAVAVSSVSAVKRAYAHSGSRALYDALRPACAEDSYLLAQSALGFVLLCHIALDSIAYGALSRGETAVVIGIMAALYAGKKGIVGRCAEIWRGSLTCRMLRTKI